LNGSVPAIRGGTPAHWTRGSGYTYVNLCMYFPMFYTLVFENGGPSLSSARIRSTRHQKARGAVRHCRTAKEETAMSANVTKFARRVSFKTISCCGANNG